MVRNIVGTLVAVGRGEMQIEMIDSLLQEPDRTSAGMTAPSHGLILERVLYD